MYYKGIERWSGSCKGLRQSPIDIKDFDTETDIYEAFKLKNYDKYITTIMENNGHTGYNFSKKQN